MMQRTIVASPGSVTGRRPVIYYIRHGETDWNREGRLQGSQDIPLNDLGRKQAAQVGQKLRDAVGARAETMPWIVSPMGRARETADIVRRQIGMPTSGYDIDTRLAEICFGAWEGLTWKDVRKASPQGAAQRSVDKWGFVPPGGESYAMLLDRVWPVFDGLAQDTVIVAHGGIARALLVRLAGLEAQEATLVDIWQGRMLVFEDGGAYWTP